MAEGGYRETVLTSWSSSDLPASVLTADSPGRYDPSEPTMKIRRYQLHRQLRQRSASKGDMMVREDEEQDAEAKDTRHSLSIEEETIQEDEILAAAEITNPPEELQAQLLRNNDRGDSNCQQQICRLTGVMLLVAVVLISAFNLAGVKEQQTESRQTNTLLENAERKVASMSNKVTTMSKAVNSMSKKVEFLMRETGWYLTRNGLAYKRFSSFRKFSKAQQVCENQDARLASTGIRDEKVRKELLNTILVEIKIGQWIGLTKPINSTWAWSDGARYTYESTPWHELQPNNNDGGCGIAYNENTSLVLYDSACEEAYPFVCERQ